MPFSHPLSTEEIEQFNHFAHEWSDPGFAMGSYKTGTLSDELKNRLTQLGANHEVRVIFFSAVDKKTQLSQDFVYAVNHRRR